MAYMKRMAMPKTWPIPRKGTVYIVAPLPGKSKSKCLPLQLVVKIAGLAKTTKEVKFILNSEKCMVNNRIVKEKAYPVGLFDTVSFPSIKKSFRVFFKNKKLFVHPINDSEVRIRPAKVINKTYLKGKKVQINLDYGNFLSSQACKVGDTLVIDTEKNTIGSHIKFDKGNLAYIVGGKHLGSVVKILEIGKFCICEIEGKHVNVLKEHIFVIGKDKPIISVPVKNEE